VAAGVDAACRAEASDGRWRGSAFRIELSHAGKNVGLLAQ